MKSGFMLDWVCWIWVFFFISLQLYSMLSCQFPCNLLCCNSLPSELKPRFCSVMLLVSGHLHGRKSNICQTAFEQQDGPSPSFSKHDWSSPLVYFFVSKLGCIHRLNPAFRKCFSYIDASPPWSLYFFSSFLSLSVSRFLLFLCSVFSIY